MPRKEENTMRDEYDFSQGVTNPYVKLPKATVTIRLDQAIVDYFKNLAEEVNIPYQTLIHSSLAHCAHKELKPSMLWK